MNDVSLHAARLPRFRSDIVERGQVDGRTILGDPLTGCYFACGPVEDAVRTAMSGRSMSLEELRQHVQRLAGVRLPPGDLQAIVDAFQRQHVLEPSLGELAGPEELAALVQRVPHWLRRRGVEGLVPTRLNDDRFDANELWRQCQRAEQHGDRAVDAVAQAIVAGSPGDDVLEELRLAVRLAWMQSAYKRQNPTWLRWLKLFCFRLPLKKRGLAWMHNLTPLASPAAFAVVLLAWLVAIGCYLQNDALPSPAGVLDETRLIELVLALPIVVLLHELAHGIVCLRYRGAVREFGVIVLLGNVLPYVDVSDTWTLPRRQRVAVSLAGTVSDLSVAAVCIVLVTLLPDWQVLGRVLLAMAAIGVLSLTVNLNPLLRFDGYFLLCDLLGVANLRAKAFRTLRHGARRLIGPTGEPLELSGRERRVVALYLGAALIMLGLCATWMATRGTLG